MPIEPPESTVSPPRGISVRPVPTHVHSPASRAVASLSVALVSHHGTEPAPLAGIANRSVQDPSGICEYDDILLFYGAGMAQELKRFATKTEGALPPVIFLAPQLDWRDVFLALHHGVMCYLLENRNPVPLADILACACRGVSVFDPGIAAGLYRLAVKTRAQEAPRGHSNAAAVAPKNLPRLTLREQQVMDLLASGRRVRDIARELALSDRTVRNYLGHIYRKLGARSQAEAILYWLGRLEPAVHRQRWHTPQVRQGPGKSPVRPV
ncbi:DNA-binding NarL/FixJ family response regulator [Streptomyces sp. B4I13]|uniref:helix-turn-helix transcriptional regulator n=1 Tax=Streptomyces sp. B4I13 TaxID=3042271 RepID=UPI0027893E4B|nr:DNA-binding NarL/FixJ family response regulator [Streptomyces sp. B4I13]